MTEPISEPRNLPSDQPERELGDAVDRAERLDEPERQIPPDQLVGEDVL